MMSRCVPLDVPAPDSHARSPGLPVAAAARTGARTGCTHTRACAVPRAVIGARQRRSCCPTGLDTRQSFAAPRNRHQPAPGWHSNRQQQGRPAGVGSRQPPIRAGAIAQGRNYRRATAPCRARPLACTAFDEARPLHHDRLVLDAVLTRAALRPSSLQRDTDENCRLQTPRAGLGALGAAGRAGETAGATGPLQQTGEPQPDIYTLSPLNTSLGAGVKPRSAAASPRRRLGARCCAFASTPPQSVP